MLADIIQGYEARNIHLIYFPKSRSRPMTLEEANDFFQILFGASGWK